MLIASATSSPLVYLPKDRQHEAVLTVVAMGDVQLSLHQPSVDSNSFNPMLQRCPAHPQGLGTPTPQRDLQHRQLAISQITMAAIPSLPDSKQRRKHETVPSHALLVTFYFS